MYKGTAVHPAEFCRINNKSGKMKPKITIGEKMIGAVLYDDATSKDKQL